MRRSIRFDEVRAWLLDHALPFWTREALDPDGFGYREQLALDGSGRDPGFKRVRTQARQVYAFSHAHLLTNSRSALQTAEIGYRDLMSLEGPQGGFPRTTTQGGAPLDLALDLYDQAFALLAMGWRYRLFGLGTVRATAHRALDALEARLSVPGRPGYRAADPDPGERVQNPHMHLLEASLVWIETANDARFRALAEQLIDMHLDLFQQDDGMLVEFFDADWRPVEGARGRYVEPGHQYEWVWLLGKAGAILGRDLETPARRLYDFAQAKGHNPVTGLCWDVIDRDGAVIKPTSRSWAQTEWLKAELALGEHWGGFDHDRIALVVDLLLDKHLAWSPAGTWMDQFDAEGRPIADHVPCSILYHMLLAFTELLRLEEQIVGGNDDRRKRNPASG